jgi:hypothetical protein
LETETPGKSGQKIKVNQQGCAGMLWFGGWVFTLGFLHLNFWNGLLALVIWPYYLGVHFSPPH